MKIGKVMKIVKKERKLTSTKLSKKMGMRLVVASDLLIHLWKKGLLDREPEKVNGNKKRYIYSLSKKGKKMFEKFDSYEEYALERSMANILQFNYKEEPIKPLED